MLVILLLHGVAAAVAPVLVRWFGRRAFVGLSLVPAGSLVWAMTHASAAADGGVDERTEWMSAFGVRLDFHLDVLALLMVTLVCGIGALILFYCTSYFDSDEPGLGRFAAMLIAFAGAMLGLVVADDIIVLYIFWELTTVFSYLLIGHDPTKLASRQAALRALIITTLGGLAMLVGLVMLGHLAGTTRLSEIVANPPEHSTFTTVAVVLILVGALSKSALFPFSFWLPGAMAAPTPVSAYLHAAAMVKAGIYLVARLGPAFGDAAYWRAILVTAGLATMFLGARRALQQYDLKLLLAHGTVSQLGFIMLLVGGGTRISALAGVAALLAHAFFKATLFLIVGIIDHSTGTRDLRKLAGIARKMPSLVVVSALALASMAGLPPFLGFVAKEAAFDSFIHGPNGWLDWLVLAGVVFSSALTFGYSARFLWGAFFSKAGVESRGVHPPNWPFLAAPTLLAVGGLVLGVGAHLLDQPLARYADSYGPVADPYHLALWHGFNLALGLTVVTVLAGLTLTRFQHRAYSSSDLGTLFGASEHTYRQTTRLVDRFALVITGLTQRGSLPVFLGTILVVLVLVPGLALVRAGLWPTDIDLWDTPAQGFVAAFIIAAAFLAVRSQHRLQSAILGGATSYGTAVLFVLHGAPDLGLTQFLVETVALVVFILILRRLPTYFSGQASRTRRRVRVSIAVAVGALMSALTATAVSQRVEPSISADMPEAAVAAGGQNIVNVTLVDFRAWDTLGEIFVLATAAIGVASLVFLRRRTRALVPMAEAGDGVKVWSDQLPGRSRPPERHGRSSGARVQTWLAGGRTLAPERRSLVLEVVTRIAFHVMIVLSIYLLLAGHNDPGGGFAGGLVAGLALVLRYLAGGRYELAEALRLDARIPLGIGLVLAVGTGMVAMLAGGEVLQSAALDLEVPLLGHLHLSSTLVFDIGVYLVVVGLVLEILTSLGVQLDRYEERAGNDLDYEGSEQDEDDDDAQTDDAGRRQTGPAAAEDGEWEREESRS